MRGTSRVAALFASAIALSACHPVGPDYVKPAAVISADFKEQAGWKRAEPRDDQPKGPWWRVFRDGELDQLEPRVAVSNQTLIADEANYREAQALIAEARASLFPTLTLDGAAQRASTAPASSVSVTGAASWTPDVWGEVRREIESQSAGARASAATLANATLSAQSSVATAYFELRETDALRDLYAETVKQYQRSLQITQNQYQAGTAAKSDVITAQALVLAAQAQQINTDVARQQFEHAIAVAIGVPPAELSIPRAPLGHDVPSVPPALPSALLERRPDVASAERTMQQENALIGVATAAYYPSFTLSGTAGFLGVAGVPLGATDPVWSYGLSAAQTLFNGGLTAAQVEAARATYASSVAAYRGTVLTALQQVEDQLVAARVLGSEASVQVKAVRAARQAVQITLNEYQAGTQSFTTVVTAEATELTDQQSELTTREQRFTAAVALIVALGGDWNVTKLPEETQ